MKGRGEGGFAAEPILNGRHHISARGERRQHLGPVLKCSSRARRATGPPAAVHVDDGRPCARDRPWRQIQVELQTAETADGGIGEVRDPDDPARERDTCLRIDIAVEDPIRDRHLRGSRSGDDHTSAITPMPSPLVPLKQVQASPCCRRTPESESIVSGYGSAYATSRGPEITTYCLPLAPR